MRSDNFSSTLVQRLNAGERNTLLVQRGLVGGFLGKLGIAARRSGDGRMNVEGVSDVIDLGDLCAHVTQRFCSRSRG